MKNKLKTFWYVFKNSIVNIQYYPEILKTRFSFSLKYLYVLYYFGFLLLGITFAVKIVTFLPKLPEIRNKADRLVTNYYPDDLIVTIKNGKLSTNYNSPYYFYLPSELGDPQMRILTIDTEAKYEDLKNLNTIGLITEDDIFFPDDNGGYRAYSLAEIDNFVFDKAMYDTISNQLLSYMKYLPALLVGLALSCIFLLPLFASSASVFGSLISCLFVSLVVWLVSLVAKSGFTYKNVYRFSMHAITIPVIYSIIMENLLGIHIPYIYTIYTIVFLVVVVIKNKQTIVQES